MRQTTQNGNSNRQRMRRCLGINRYWLSQEERYLERQRSFLYPSYILVVLEKTLQVR